jgi:hypothetical protein
MSAVSDRGATFDKFAWLRALREDARFTDKEARLGMAICTDCVRRNGRGWLVDLNELAASVPGNVSRNWLNAALQKFIRHGYLAETSRAGGGRGLTARRSHDLVPQPVKPASVAGPDDAETHPATGVGNDESHPATGVGIEETHPATDVNPPLHRVKPTPVAGDNVRADLREATPKGLRRELLGDACAREAEPAAPEPLDYGDDPPEDQTATNDEPAASAAASAAPPHIAALPVALIHWPDEYPECKPAERCPTHADWNTDEDGPVPKCGACGDRRKAPEAWEARRSKWFTRRGDARRAWNTECGECDDEGWILDPWDELPAPLRCPHATIWWAWWQHHRAHQRCDTHTDVPLADAIGCPDCDLADRREAAS